MKLRALLPLLAVLLIASGCYHASVVTGETPGEVVIEKEFASSWINWLVPPETVDTASQCPNGVAIIETELSFLNQLVGALTMGIYTPMRIVVTCAAEYSTSTDLPDADITIAEDASEEEVADALADAANETTESGEGVVVQFVE